jgi:hypothetical protein
MHDCAQSIAQVCNDARCGAVDAVTVYAQVQAVDLNAWIVDVFVEGRDVEEQADNLCELFERARMPGLRADAGNFQRMIRAACDYFRPTRAAGLVTETACAQDLKERMEAQLKTIHRYKIDIDDSFHRGQLTATEMLRLFETGDEYCGHMAQLKKLREEAVTMGEQDAAAWANQVLDSSANLLWFWGNQAQQERDRICKPGGREEPWKDDAGDGDTSDDSSDDDDGQLRLPRFDGAGSWWAFAYHFTNLTEYYGWSEHDQRSQLLAALKGEAGDAIRICGTDAPLGELMKCLQERYAGKALRCQAREALKFYRQKEGQSLQQLMIDLVGLCDDGYPGVSFTAVDTYIKLPAFLDALLDEELRLQVVLQGPMTSAEALDKAMNIETALLISRGHQSVRQPRRARHPAKLLSQLNRVIHRGSLSCRNRYV